MKDKSLELASSNKSDVDDFSFEIDLLICSQNRESTIVANNIY